jgi:hypothetical protein
MRIWIWISSWTFVWVGTAKIVKVGDLKMVDFGVVCNLAMALVEHVLPHGFEGAELLPLAIAVDADVAHSNLLTEVQDEALDIDEVLGVWDKEGVGGGNVCEIVVQQN